MLGLALGNPILGVTEGSEPHLAGWVSLAWCAIAVTALVLAPFPRFGARTAGLLLAFLGQVTLIGQAFGVFATESAVAAVTVGMIAFVATSALAAGWTYRRRVDRRYVRVLGTSIALMALVAIGLLLPFVLRQGNEGVFFFLYEEDYAEIGPAVAFAAALGGLWLGSLLLGFGTAPQAERRPTAPVLTGRARPAPAARGTVSGRH